MKRTSIILIVLVTALYFAVTFSWAQQTKSSSQEDTGRYQLFQGYYTVFVEAKGNGSHSTVEAKAVFKIDTKTGDVWKYNEAIIDGELKEIFYSVTIEK